MNQKALNHSLEFIGSWLGFRYDCDEVPGFVVAISRRGKVIFNRAYGFADLENKTQLTPGHIFRIASHSKTFTATAVMQLQERGKLRIDDRIAEYLPWLNDHKDKRWQKVTIRQLLSHGAGVTRDGLQSDYWQLERSFPEKQEFKKELLAADLVLDNNTKLKYSNYGYTLLGMLIEAIAGQPYNQHVAKNIIKPLGLKHTGPEPTLAVDRQAVTGYSRADINKRRLPIAPVDTRAMSPATGFYSTAEDLCKYFTAQMVGSNKLLDDESKKEMQRAQWHASTPYQREYEDYGLGIEIEYIGKRRVFGHGGGFPGQITESLADQEDKLVVVALTNCIDGSAAWIAKNLYSIIDYFQQNTPTSKTKHDMSRLEGRYLNLWSIVDIVVTGDRVVATHPDTWDVLTQYETLTYVNDTTLKVSETNSFRSEGELVHFNIRNDKVVSVNYCGATLWPEATWLKKQGATQVIGKH